MNIGWIGLGNIGAPAALRLLDGGHRLKVHDLRREAAVSHLEKGACWVESAEEVARGSDIVFTCLPFPPDVESVVLGSKGVLEGISAGSVFGDVTTNRVSVTRRLYEVLAAKGVSMLDMPISGGHITAAAGTMAIWIGGDEATYNRVRPVLELMGRPMYCGPSGSGNICKLVNNLVWHIVIEGMLEGLTLGVKAGIPLGKLIEALSMAVLGKPVVETFTSRVMGHGARLDLAAATVQFACELARELRVPMEVSSLVDQRYIEALAKGWGDLPPGAIQKVFECRSGIALEGPLVDA